MLRRRWLLGAPLSFLRWSRPTPAELGLVAEELVARELARRGWRVVGRRVATRAAEIDIVALDHDETVCVEVKSGRAGRWRPGEHLRPRPLARQRRAAREVARRLSRDPRKARVDLAELVVDAHGVPAMHLQRDLRRIVSGPGAPSFTLGPRATDR